MNTFTLKNGLKIPALGFGTYKATLEATALAIETGCEYLDTAPIYKNESEVAEAIKISGVKREKLFIASKVWKTDMGYHETRAAFFRTLEKLRLDYLDAYLIHWPRPDLARKDWKNLDLETWRAMEELHKEGKIRVLGLSNFLPHHAENILKNCAVMPEISQIEFHPGYTQFYTVNYFRQKKILLQAWSPTARGRIFNDELIIELAEKYSVSPAQLCIAFCARENIMPLVKASTREHLQENFDALNIAITDEDISRLESLPQMGWGGEHPDRERVII